MTEKVNYVEVFNGLVAEANQITKSTRYKPVKRFADADTAEKRCKVMQETVEALRSNIPPSDATAPETSTPKPSEAQSKSQAEAQPKKDANVTTTKKTSKSKTKAKKAVKTKVAKAKVTKAVKPVPAGIVGQVLGSRGNGTKKAKLLGQLADNKGKPVPRKKLVQTVYGNTSKESMSAFAMCMGGLIKTVKQKRAGMIERIVSEDKEVSFALSTKG